MTRMTDDARQRVESYLRRVRASLADDPAADEDEVAEGIREHLEHALSGVDEPVTVAQVERVLDELGDPGSWSDTEAAGWRALLSRLHRGPEDWRLAYLAFGTFVLGLAFADPLWFLLPASFFLARAGVSVGQAAEGRLAGKRWLLYPPLVLVYLALVPGALLWPVATVHAGVSPGGFLVDLVGLPAWSAGLLAPEAWPVVGPWAGTALGVWWVAAGLVVRARPGWARTLFRPLADRVESAHGRVLSLAGIAVTLVSVGLLLF